MGYLTGNDMADKVLEFHRAAGIDVAPHGQLDLRDSLLELRLKLHYEETKELIDALGERDPLAIARELADVVVVAYGTALSLGIDLDAAVAEVMRANMAKVVGGTVVRRADGKVLKPPGWQPPDMTVAIPSEATRVWSAYLELEATEAMDAVMIAYFKNWARGLQLILDS